MSSSITDYGQSWLQSKQYLEIAGIKLLPLENQVLKNTPLMVSRGQAEAYFLKDNNSQEWILKKFLPGRNPDSQYIRAISALVPQQHGFEAGYKRTILSSTNISPNGYYSRDFANWLENTILMPQIKACDWAYLADKVRDGNINLSNEQRLLLCKNLSKKIRLLEQNGLSHRDLSSTNVFINTTNWEVDLIDWDSLYHKSLSMPPNTTYGTNGYVAPFVRVNGNYDARLTWQDKADRFSLAVLNTEILIIEKNSPLTGDGGLVNQDEIYQMQGTGLTNILSSLKAKFPNAVPMFEKALKAKTFDACPSSDEWISFSGIGSGYPAPSLRDMYNPKDDFVRFLQDLQKPKPLVPKAPSLGDLGNPRKEILNILNPQKNSIAPQTQTPKLSDVEDPSISLNSMPQKNRP